MKNSLKTSAIAAVIALSSVLPVYAADEHNVSSGVTTSGKPLGLQGIDAVALSTLYAVAEGKADHTVVAEGVAYYFASAESAQEFEAQPEKYLPQFGGFCAFAVALGKKFDGDPNYADIVDGKLYLFVNAEIFAEYRKDSKAIIAKAHNTWPKIEQTPVIDL